VLCKGSESKRLRKREEEEDNSGLKERYGNKDICGFNLEQEIEMGPERDGTGCLLVATSDFWLGETTILYDKYMSCWGASLLRVHFTRILCFPLVT
jgi:hypothetical protein